MEYDTEREVYPNLVPNLIYSISISAYCLFGVVHISVNVNQVIEFIPP